MNYLTRLRTFTGEQNPKFCYHRHRLNGTGVFFQSVGFIQCAVCKGWQQIEEPIQ